jgi:hypothetical protein
LEAAKYVFGVSKAFTRESDAVSADEIAPLRPHSPSGDNHYITREGADRLREQVSALLEERRVRKQRTKPQGFGQCAADRISHSEASADHGIGYRR